MKYILLNKRWLRSLKKALLKERIITMFRSKVKEEQNEQIKQLKNDVSSLRYAIKAIQSRLEIYECLKPFVEYKMFNKDYNSSSEKAQLIKDGFELCGFSESTQAEVWKKK